MCINWCLFVYLVYVRCSHAALSGLYIDNGVDQTIIHHTMTRTEKQMVELEILELLGLGERPRRARAPALDRSAPNFLLDVYRQLAEDFEQPHPTRPTRASHDDTIPLTGDDQQHIDESDVIMTFQSKKHNLGALRHGHGQHVWFDVGALPAEQQLVSAALRLHQAAPFRDLAAQGALYTVSVHKVLSVDNFGSLKMLEVTAVNTTAAYEGWLELNVTGVLATWTSSPADNKGFFVTVHAHSMPERDLKPEIIGIEDEHAAEGKQPFMVAFFKATGRINSVEVAVSRKKRETRRRRKDYGYSENYIRNPLTDASHWTTRSCEIQTLYVSFKDLEWQDWIIAPDGYGAYYCSGECNFPLNAHKNATNHAIVQTLVHLLNPTQVPKPSCAPTKLSAISVLYYTDDSNVILRKYKNMVVKSCGCH